MTKEWLYKANAHHWGPGKSHLIDADGLRTFCGKLIAEIPGFHLPMAKGKNALEEVSCKMCLQAVESRKRQAEWEAKMLVEKAEQEQRNREWWRRYNEYLQSEQWRERRKLVFQRASWICEGCGKARCTQVHHLTYERAFNETLFDLVAVCDDCHARLHPERELQVRLEQEDLEEVDFLHEINRLKILMTAATTVAELRKDDLREILGNWEKILDQIRSEQPF